MTKSKTMRDALIERIYEEMKTREDIYFLSADMGAPLLDKLRVDFADRFVNVGIAEQSLINTATGLALEGYTVYAYLIAPFAMRAYEVIRNNLAISTAIRPMNVNIIGVGAGFSYEVSGPTHHCLEDLAVMRVLPNMEVFSPSDYGLAQEFVQYTLDVKKPKYIRCDGKPLPLLEESIEAPISQGFRELAKGEDVCLVGTGVATHIALEAAELLRSQNIKAGVVDTFLLKPLDADKLRETLSSYSRIVTIQEALVGCGGLDSTILALFDGIPNPPMVTNLGVRDAYCFEYGNRQALHKIYGLDPESVVKAAINQQ